MKTLRILKEYSNQIKEQQKRCLINNNLEDAEKLQILLNEFKYCEDLILYWKNIPLNDLDNYITVYFLNDVIFFKSINEAVKKTGVSRCNIVRNLKGVNKSTRIGVFSKKIINRLEYKKYEDANNNTNDAYLLHYE